MSERFKLLADLPHFISTRPLNAAESEDRAQFLKEAGIPVSALVTGKQVHGINSHVVTLSDRGKEIPATDALIANIPGIALMVRAAAVGTVHAGWRGTVGRILKLAVEKMKTEFASDPKDIFSGIGPAIGPECFEVGEEVIAAAKNSLKDTDELIIKKGGSTYFNLKEANRRQLIEAGVPKKNIEVMNVCTKCRHDRFFSARADGAKTGRSGAGIMVRAD